MPSVPPPFPSRSSPGRASALQSSAWARLGFVAMLILLLWLLVGLTLAL